MFLCSSIASAANVTADFSANVTSGDNPLSVQFTDASFNATEWYWDFNNDGTNDSTTQNPVFTYSSDGTYTVVLTAVNGTESDVETKTDYITVTTASTYATPVADFSANVTSGDNPLAVQFTDASTNATEWYWDFDNDGTNDSTTQNPVFTYSSDGTYTVVLTAVNGTESDVETKTDYITVTTASTYATPVADFSANVTSGDNPLAVQFTDTSTNATEWYWDFDNDGTNDSTTQNPVFTYTSDGTYTVVLTAVNGTESDVETKTDYITVSTPSSNPPVASFDTSATSGAVPFTVTFNDTSTNSPTSWSWDFDDGDTSTEQHPVHTFDTVGTYNVTLEATNGDGADTSDVTTITVYPQTYYTGDRIWDENADQSEDKYTWDAKSFSGFFYDLESGLSSENMTIYDIDRSLGDGDIVYQTRPVETDFENSDWGSYQIIGFMAEKYFAGYTGNTTIDGVDEVSLMSAGQLSKILLDVDDKESVYSGSSLILEDGYELNVIEVDVNGESVYVTLTQDGDEVDSGVISSGDDYVYETDLGDADDVALIIVHFDEVFSGTETNAVFVEGVFQISDDYIELDDGETYGEMEITSISDELIEMENEDTVSLSKGDSITLMGKIKIEVADNDDLRFAPYVDMSDPGTYELRGTVAEEDDLLTWTPLNFEGFYYDIDEGIQTEKLELTAISGRTIDDGDLVYTSTPDSVDFEYSSWGEFEVIGFMAEKYFAGYTDDTDIDGVDEISLMSNGQLSKVLLDDDDESSVYSGSSLILEEGYTLDVIEVDTNGESVLIELYQDGDEVDTGIVSANDDYVYETDLGDADDVPIIIVHFNEVFAGTESNAVFIEGVFQISEDYISLEDGDSYGEMEITSYGEDSIVMKNEDSISLSSDKDISLMGEVGIRVADSGTLRYYPYVEVTTAASQALSIDLSESTVTEGDEVTITVTSRGSQISDATVKVEGTTIGTTDDEGTIDYDADEVGTFEITASKDGYTSDSQDLEVIDPDDETRKMSIEVSPDEVYEGSSITIFVLQAIGGNPVSGATVTFDGASIGTTDSDGTVTYTTTETGTHSIEATKDGMNDAELDLKVNELAAEFEFSNLEISPLEIKQGQEAIISADVINTGTAEGSYNVELKVNGVVVDSQTITLSVGNSTTVEFTHEEEEPGTYEVELGDLTTTYEVFERSGTVWYVLGAVGLAAIGGVAYLFTAGGWTVEIAQAKAAEAIEALKELIGQYR
ncbi:S-layer protein domain-containing protein [Methanolobus bombayensis]|uniref:S-layer protein domain-containing protein n=1 Tax=Methanolobus bombayensis TaxID=38023 RepID=UPI001FD84FB0|nr:S-layer protein domain-containing protein [Methanolobus bombayensis]MBP1908103.1 S-layer protein (TIGR01567 family) [Methanolobus bombayensis]